MSATNEPQKDSSNPKNKSKSKGESEDQPTPPVNETGDNQSQEDDLPQREPLTPELVEDEAIRGDFMLRWALVLLALLMACTEITETPTLVHVKSGEFTLENGIARTGVMSSSADESPWHNLNWLFDVLLAGIFAMGGAIGLSVFKAILGGVLFGIIVHINRDTVSSWWGTICAGLALLVCYPRFSAQPEFITFIGLALTLYFLHRWRENGERKPLQNLVILFAIWSNLDPRMFLGLAVILFYAMGEWTGNWLGSTTGLPDDKRRKTLWITVGICLLVTLLNPFGWHALLAPISLYGSEYPALRGLYPNLNSLRNLSHYPMTTPEFWSLINHNTIAGLVLILTAFVTFGLNYKKLDFGHLFVGLGFTAFSILAIHELPATAIVVSVLATLNAQQWYQHTFRQTYSTQTSELVFSRGGRAVTVLALFGLAYLSISGRMDLLDREGRLSRRLGFGFSSNLQSSISGLEEELKDSYDIRPFNFVPSQGDLLIWIDQKAFIDSRIGLYAGHSDKDFIEQFKHTQNSLRASNKPGEEGRKWQAVLNKYRITHVIPRLDPRFTGSAADFITFRALFASSDWRLTHFGATSAVFYRTDLLATDPDLAKHVKKYRIDFLQQAFGPSSNNSEPRNESPRLPTFSEKYLSLPRRSTSNEMQLSDHYREMVLILASDQLPQQLLSVEERTKYQSAFLHLLIRNASSGLVKDPQNVRGYHRLGSAYSALGQQEVQMLKPSGQIPPWKVPAIQRSIRVLQSRRDLQAISAFRQSLVLEPDNIDVLRAIAVLYERQGMFDLSRDYREKCIEYAEQHPIPENTEEERRDFLNDIRKSDFNEFAKLNKALQQPLKVIQDNLPKMTDTKEGHSIRMGAVQFALQNRCTQKTIELLEGVPDLIAADPRAGSIYVNLLYRSGQIYKATSKYEEYNSKFEQLQGNQNWRLLGANLGICRADYSGAKSVWMLTARKQDSLQSLNVAENFPLSARAFSTESVHRRMQQVMDPADRIPYLWMTEQTRNAIQALYVVPYTTADYLFQAALCDLDAGRNTHAAETMQQALEVAPDGPLRPLLRFYLQLITDKPIPKTAEIVEESALAKKKPATQKTVPTKAIKPKSAMP